MARNDHDFSGNTGGYDLASDPVVGSREIPLTDSEIENPSVSGDVFLIGLARDPKTIFACWSVDWEAIFAGGAPPDRQVHLLASADDGSDEVRIVAEPLQGTATLDVGVPGATYKLELGYFAPADRWHRVAVADPVTMPAAGTAPSLDFEIATIPLHLSFQRMIDLFRESNGNQVVASVVTLQTRAASDGMGSLSEGDREILRALEFTDEDAQDVGTIRTAFTSSGQHFARRIDSLLGLGATSAGGNSMGGS